MGKRGPKKKTAAQSKRKPASAAPSDAWKVPPYLKGEARAAWLHVVKLLAATGSLDRTDPTLIEAYAVNVDLLRLARKRVELEGITILNGAGCISAHPACSTINSASMRLKGIISDLGLCPASSKYAASAPVDDKTDGDWGDYLSVTG